MMQKKIIQIIVAPSVHAPGRFTASITGNGALLVAASRTPFFDAARQLLALSYPADCIIVMKYAGADIECLRTMIGLAAITTVKEKNRGSAPRFARWEAYTRPSPVAPTIPSNASRAIGVAASHGAGVRGGTGDSSPSPPQHIVLDRGEQP